MTAGKQIGEVTIFALHPPEGELEWIGVQRLPDGDAFHLSDGMLLCTSDGSAAWRIVTFGFVSGTADLEAAVQRDLVGIRKERGSETLRRGMRLMVYPGSG